MAHQIQFNPPIVQESVNFLLQLLQTQLFVNVTVKQLMEGKQKNEEDEKLFLMEFFLGYTDPLIEAASIVKPGVLKDNKFGILQPVIFQTKSPRTFHSRSLSCREMVHITKTSRFILDSMTSLKQLK